MKRLVGILICLALFVPSGIVFSGHAQTSQPLQIMQSPDETPLQSGDGTWYVIDLENTPLVKGIDNAHNNKEGEKPEKVKGDPKSKQLKYYFKKKMCFRLKINVDKYHSIIVLSHFPTLAKSDSHSRRHVHQPTNLQCKATMP